jgi:hypothetical protein
MGGGNCWQKISTPQTRAVNKELHEEYDAACQTKASTCLERFCARDSGMGGIRSCNICFEKLSSFLQPFEKKNQNSIVLQCGTHVYTEMYHPYLYCEDKSLSLSHF